MRRAYFPGFDEDLKRFQDWDLWLTMLANNNVGIFVPEILFRASVTRIGISSWRPRLWYFFWSSVRRYTGLTSESYLKYMAAKEIILRKHHLL